MRDRFKNPLYTREIKVYRDHHFRYVESDDGTLYSGHNRTKILAQDLPEWYLFGRYYKCWGYMSTKGVTDLLYVPNKCFNHFLKDDGLYISYGGKITETVPPEDGSYYDRYTGYDEVVWGAEIVDILQGARLYSGYDISGMIQQIKEKKEWLIHKYPDEFGPEHWNFDVDKQFATPLENGHPPKFYALTLDSSFSPSFVSGTKRYYGTLEMIQAFIESLDYEKHKSTIDTFREFTEGNTAAAHNVAYIDQPLLQPVTVIKSSFLYLANEEWEFKNIWDCVYKMRVKGATTTAYLIKDREKYIRCICPRIEGLCYQSELIGVDRWSPVRDSWGQPGILKFDPEKEDVIRSALYFPERQYDDVKKAVAALDGEKISLNAICDDIFADG